jgi:hypothetical protein
MTFDASGYVLSEKDGEPVWFLDTRMIVGPPITLDPAR